VPVSRFLFFKMVSKKKYILGEDEEETTRPQSRRTKRTLMVDYLKVYGKRVSEDERRRAGLVALKARLQHRREDRTSDLAQRIQRLKEIELRKFTKIEVLRTAARLKREFRFGVVKRFKPFAFSKVNAERKAGIFAEKGLQGSFLPRVNAFRKFTSAASFLAILVSILFFYIASAYPWRYTRRMLLDVYRSVRFYSSLPVAHTIKQPSNIVWLSSLMKKDNGRRSMG
jgi:hypothetical protein